MTLKKTNVLLLISVVISLLISIDPLGLFKNTIIGISKLVEYGITVIIGIIMLKKNGENVLEFLPYDVKPKLKTMLWVIALFVLIYPVNAMMAGIGGRYLGDILTIVENEAPQMLVVKNSSKLLNLFNSAVIPAVFEEIFYRGFFYQGYKKAKGARVAILMTSILFGTFHMVPQQFLYTVPAGFVLAVLRELTGSMWPGTFLHFLNNGMGVFEEGLWEIAPWLNHFNFENKTNELITVISAFVCIVLIILVLRRISKIEGREADFKTFFKEERDRLQEEKIVSAPLVITLILQMGMMLVSTFIAIAYSLK